MTVATIDENVDLAKLMEGILELLTNKGVLDINDVNQIVMSSRKR